MKKKRQDSTSFKMIRKEIAEIEKLGKWQIIFGGQKKSINQDDHERKVR